MALPVLAKQVILIHSYHLEYPWVAEYRNGFIESLEAGQLLEYTLDTKRQPSENFAKIADYAWNYIQRHQPDIVVLADDNALKLLGSRLIENGIPIVFLGINNNPRQYVRLSERVTGVLERPLMKRSIASLKKINPSLTKIKLLTDDTTSSKAMLKTSLNDATSQSIHHIRVDMRIVKTAAQWREEVLSSKAQGYQAIVIALYARLENAQGEISTLNEISEWTSRFSPIPVFAFWAISVGKDKAIGGLLISGHHQGVEAAIKVNNFFNNGALCRITTPQRGNFIFSRQQLKRWNITLPPEIAAQTTYVD